MAITKTDSGWLVDLQPGGRSGPRIRKTLPTKAEALQYEAWRKSTVLQTPDWAPAKKDMRRLDELIEDWFDLHGKQLRAGENAKGRLLYVSQALGNPIASSLTPEMFTEYRASRLKSRVSVDGKRTFKNGVTASHLNRELAYMRAMFNELTRLGYWHGKNPVEGIRHFKVPERELSFLALEQIPVLLKELEAAREQDALLITKVCLATGARWGEGENLKASQIRKGQIQFSGTKSGKNRSVPVSEELIAEIQTHHKQRWGEDHKTVQRYFQTADGAFREGVERAGIKLPRGQMTHVLRHTFASHFMMNGGNILTLQRILGHSSLQMTMRYAHLAPDHLQEAKLLNPLGRL